MAVLSIVENCLLLLKYRGVLDVREALLSLGASQPLMFESCGLAK